MPYWLHDCDKPADTGREYEAKATALADRQDGQTVTFVASETERADWRRREQDRFYAGTYVNVPWSDDLCSEETVYHFAHVSLDVPGMIAYTPDDEKGIADRQTRVKPGRYLQQFFGSRLTPEQIADYASRVKAYTEDLKLATTPDDIARVYCANDGPTSCMDGRHFSFDECPARAYGDSDLAIAYIGEIIADDGRNRDSRIAARAIVWPVKKVYGRIYGDTATLQHVLTAAGYEKGDMIGARIRAIDTPNGYLCPYIDGIGSASLDGKWIVLDDSGDLDVQNVRGYASGGNTCSECGDRCGEDEIYCSSCDDMRRSCDHCGIDYFGDDAGSYSDARGEWICDGCLETHSHTCQHCGESFNEYDFSRRAWNSRNNDLCDDCHDSVSSCSECGEYSDDTDSDRVCSDCRKCSECGDVCEEASDRDDQDRCEDCHDKAFRLTPARPKGTILRLHRVGIGPAIERIQVARNLGDEIAVDATPLTPFLYLHRTIDRADRWTLTHKPTGLAVSTYIVSETAGRNIADRLRDLDWAFISGDAIPPATSSYVREIISQYRNAGGIR